MGEVLVNRWQASDTELVTALTDAEVRLRQAYSEMLALLSEVDCRGVAPKLGYSNTPALLVHTLRISRPEARRRLVHAAEPVRAERELRRYIKRDGTLEFSGRLDAESAQLFEAVLAPFDKSDPGVEDHRGYAERAGDAFVDVLKMAGNSPELPTHNGVKAEVALTVSWKTLRDALDDVVLPGDSGLTAGEARRIACDSHILPAVMNGNSKPVDVAVPAYVVPAHIRRALILRDRGCAFPACDSHHIQSWLRGGPTQLDNLVLLCGSHH